jgi:hypothetical protein
MKKFHVQLGIAFASVVSLTACDENAYEVSFRCEEGNRIAEATLDGYEKIPRERSLKFSEQKDGRPILVYQQSSTGYYLYPNSKVHDEDVKKAQHFCDTGIMLINDL